MELEKNQKSKKHPEVPKYLAELIESGIPVKKAVFHRAVIFAHKTATPQTAYYAMPAAVNGDKLARMWLTPHLLVCEQAGAWKCIPLANVSDTDI